MQPNSQRLQDKVRSLNAISEIPKSLTFLARTPVINQTEEQLEKALGVGEQFTFFAPNIKIGENISKPVKELYDKHGKEFISAAEADLLLVHEAQTAKRLLTGVQQTMNRLICDANLGRYQTHGFDIFEFRWGMPRDLIIESRWMWSHVNAAKPFDDFERVKSEGKKFDVVYDRATISTGAFKDLINTNQFAERYGKSREEIKQTELKNLVNFVSAEAGFELEFEDITFRVRTEEGPKATRVMPKSEIIFSCKTFDNNPDIIYFANCPVSENGIYTPEGFRVIRGEDRQPLYGPVSYYTADSGNDLNTLKSWCFLKGFPVRKFAAATAVLRTR